MLLGLRRANERVLALLGRTFPVEHGGRMPPQQPAVAPGRSPLSWRHQPLTRRGLDPAGTQPARRSGAGH